MLKNFKLVNTDGLKGLMYEGRLIPFDKINDTRAEQLIGKTHVLERVAEAPAAPAVAVAELAAADASEPAATASSRAKK